MGWAARNKKRWIRFGMHNGMKLAPDVLCLGESDFQDENGNKIPFFEFDMIINNIDDLMVFDRRILEENNITCFIRRRSVYDLPQDSQKAAEKLGREKLNNARMSTHAFVSAFEGRTDFRYRLGFTNLFSNG